MQKFIFNNLSEVEQTIRMDSHPSLVKTPETQAGTGAGSIISMPENLDGALKPYLLEYNGASVTSIYDAIEHARDAIDKMANTGSVRATTSKTMSGIAMQTEFQLLNAKIAEKADNLELAEESIWQLFAQYQNYVWDGEIDYPGNFSIQDEEKEYTMLQTAKAAATGAEACAVIDQMIIDLITDDTVLEGRIIVPGVGQSTSDAVVEQITTPAAGGEHPSLATMSQAARLAHIQTMLMEGYSNDEILALHPELVLQDIVDAGAAAAANN
jgi:hypothetical protein